MYMYFCTDQQTFFLPCLRFCMKKSTFLCEPVFSKRKIGNIQHQCTNWWKKILCFEMVKVCSGILFWNLAVSLFIKARLRWGKECQDYRIAAVATTGQLAKKPAAQLKVQWGKLPSWIKKTSSVYVIHSFISVYFTFLPYLAFEKMLKEWDEIF